MTTQHSAEFAYLQSDEVPSESIASSLDVTDNYLAIHRTYPRDYSDEEIIDFTTTFFGLQAAAQELREGGITVSDARDRRSAFMDAIIADKPEEAFEIYQRLVDDLAPQE